MYFENHKIFDRILIGREINVYCEKSDLILFNEKCLYGASMPEKTIRKSINFQIFNKNAIENIDVDNFEKNKLLLFSNIDLINYLDLISFGDKVGANRIKKQKIYQKIY